MAITSEIVKLTIDVILPAYNPHHHWEHEIVENFNRLKNGFTEYNFRLFIVTDGAKKGYEPDVLEYLNQNLPDATILHYNNNRGKGYALRYAVERCPDDWIIYIDYDFPYTDNSIKKVLCSLASGADVVVATRKSSYQNNLPFLRKRLSHMSHTFNRYILNIPIRDTQGGMKGFNKKGRTVFLSTKICTFLFDTEFIYKAFKKGYNVVAIDAEIKEGLKVSSMGIKVIFREFLNVLEIIKR